MLTCERRSIVTTEPERDDIAYMAPQAYLQAGRRFCRYQGAGFEVPNQGRDISSVVYIIRFQVPERRLSSHSQLITLCWPYAGGSGLGDGDP